MNPETEPSQPSSAPQTASSSASETTQSAAQPQAASSGTEAPQAASTSQSSSSAAPTPASQDADPGRGEAGWDQLLERLRQRYPGQKDSVLFCLNKLQQNPELTLRDIRDEAAMYGIPTAGRALHSAKVLLGLAEAKPRKPRASIAQPDAPATAAANFSFQAASHAPSPPNDGASVENRVMDAVRRLQSAASADSERLRDAMRRAIAILQEAVDGTDGN